MRIQLLGRVTVAVGGHRWSLPRSQVRGLFALLALHAGDPVSVPAVIEALWGGRAPRTARTRVHDYASTIRRSLLDWGAPDCLESGRFGYLLKVSPDVVDALDQAAGIREARACTDPVKAVARYREALALWSGEPLADASGVFVDGTRIRLADQYLGGIEAVTELELGLGEHDAVAAELSPLADRFPLRERLTGNLMLALHRGGDRPAALAVFRRCRAELAETLGLEPGTELQQLHRAILAADPALSPESARVSRPVPAQLPFAPAMLTGRDRQLATLDEAGSSGRIVVVSGRGGVGKTALAVAWAHQNRRRFPDGQLYVNLHGFSLGAPLDPAAAVAGFLRALGVPGEQIPAEAEQAAARLRTELAGARALMVLDNAADAAQVRPLLPGGDSVTVIVTSRDRLSGLTATHDATQIALESLAPQDAADLIRRLLPERRLTGDEAGQLARRCSHLPLALRIAAARLRDEPELPVRHYLAEVEAGLGGLAIAGDTETAIRATFEPSYARLDSTQRRVFRRLALVPGEDFEETAVARLAALSPPKAKDHLAGLVAAHLVDVVAGGRYAMHDLVRAYAAEKVAADETAKQIRSSRDRLFGWYLAMARAAATLMLPELPLLPGPVTPVWTGPAGARQWLEAHRVNLVAAVAVAESAGLPEYCWRLPDALRGFLWHSAHRTDWLGTASRALAAATASGDAMGLAAAHLNLGWYHFACGHDADALAHYTAAAGFAERAGWAQARSSALLSCARAERDLGRLDAALTHARLTLSLESARGSGTARESMVHALIASICLQSGSLDEALHHGELATTGGASATLNAIHTVILADVHLARGETDAAAARFTQARDVFERVGHDAGQAKCRTGLGAAAIDAGRHAEAEAHLDAALDLARRAGDQGTEAEASHQLGRLMVATGRPALALGHLDRACELSSVPMVRAAALSERERALAALGRQGHSSTRA